jgi:multidrug efflux pump subunit AcrA (membrane-fusion protein)
MFNVSSQKIVLNQPVSFPMLLAQEPMKTQQSMEGMSMNQESSGDRMTAPGTVLGLVILVSGMVVVAGALLFRRKRVVQDLTEPMDQESIQLESMDQDSSQPEPKGSILSTKTALAAGVLAILMGSILTATTLFKPASLMADMQGMEGMSMEDMMRVDGSANAMPVTVEAIKPGLMEASVRYTGTVRPYQEVTVYPRVEGQLTAYSVYPGTQVAAGQVLANLSAAELSSDVDEAIAETQASRSEVEAARAELAEHHREIERMAAEYTYWNKALPRAQTLLQKGVISQEEFDKEKSQADVAQAALRGARTKLVTMQAKIDTAEAKVAQAVVKRQRTAIVEGYRVVKSPITGIVQERMVDPGVLVQPGMGILKIGDYSRVRLQANVAQQDAIKIQVGSLIVARLSGKSTDKINGNITSIFPKAGDETRTVTVEAVVDNPGRQLLAGQFLEMSIITDRKAGALSVPQATITQFNGKPAVWVMAGAVAQHREITTGMTSGDRTEVTHGLNPGDQVITSGQDRLIENAKVAAVDASGKPIASLSNDNQGNVRIQLISPKDKAIMGDNQLILEVQDPNTGKPMSVKGLEVEAVMQMKNMAPMKTEVEVTPDTQPGRFKVKTYLGMRGSWQINAKVKESKRGVIGSMR